MYHVCIYIHTYTNQQRREQRHPACGSHLFSADVARVRLLQYCMFKCVAVCCSMLQFSIDVFEFNCFDYVCLRQLAQHVCVYAENIFSPDFTFCVTCTMCVNTIIVQLSTAEQDDVTLRDYDSKHKRKG